jgi:hypothetical protein
MPPDAFYAAPAPTAALPGTLLRAAAFSCDVPPRARGIAWSGERFAGAPARDRCPGRPL